MRIHRQSEMTGHGGVSLHTLENVDQFPPLIGYGMPTRFPFSPCGRHSHIRVQASAAVLALAIHGFAWEPPSSGWSRFGSVRVVSNIPAVQAVQVEYFDRPKIIVSKNQIVVPPENDVFDIFEGIGCQLRFQILNWMKRADPCFGVCRNSAWSPSYDFFFPEIAKIWTTPSTGYY